MLNKEKIHLMCDGLRLGMPQKLIAERAKCSIYAVSRMSRKRPIRVLLWGDSHCGSNVGLTPPAYQTKFTPDPKTEEHRTLNKWAQLQEESWNWYIDRLNMLKPIDKLFVLGDAIDGTGHRSGGTELIFVDRKIQVRMAIEALEAVEAKDMMMVYGCLTAGHRILTADLRYIPVEQLREGDKLLAFESNQPKGKLRRKWIESEVIGNSPIRAEVYELSLSDGTTLQATGEHPFLIKATGREYRWRTVRQMYKYLHYADGKRNRNPFIQFNRILPVWETNKSYEAAYLAGFFDGEGSCSQRLKECRNNWAERIFSVSASQKNNIVLATVKKYLSKLRIPFSVSNKYKEDPDMFNLFVRGGIAQCLRFLGEIRPKRLLENFSVSKLGSIRTSHKDNTTIIDIQPIGIQTVWALGTTSGTYISEGFLSHNTPYHTGDSEDFELDIAQHFKCKIGGHEWEDVNGCVFDLKHKQGNCDNPATGLFQQIRDHREWAGLGEQPKANILVRAHTHRFCITKLEDCIGIAIPALQSYGTRFGSRQCSRKVQFGLVALDVWPDGVVVEHISIAKLAGHITHKN